MTAFPASSHKSNPIPAVRPASRWVLALTLTLAFIVGVVIRQLAFEATGPIRYELNQQNAFYWGDKIVHGFHGEVKDPSWGDFWHSYLAVYDANEAHPAVEPNQFDYVPLRLLMAGVWVKYLDSTFGTASAWRPEFARSFCAFSMVMELTGAVAMFMLVASWLKQTQLAPSFDSIQSRRSADADRWWYAGVAAILLWLNPAAIVDSHVWPHGQTWILPFYLFAILAMIEDRFFIAGAVFGLGAMFKGQMMLVAPMLILWPLFDRRWLAALRVVVGMACGVAAAAWPWLIRGSMAWARIGFAAKVGFTDVLRKGDALNFPGLLEKHWHMTLHQHVVDRFILGMHLQIELRLILLAVYLVLLLCCSHGIARQAKRRDPRLLISIAAPWALMFFFLGQMDERYLVWSACFSAGAICVGSWATGAHLALTWAGLATMVEFLLVSKPTVCPWLMRTLIALNPATWLVTGIAVVYLIYVSIMQSSGRPKFSLS